MKRWQQLNTRQLVLLKRIAAGEGDLTAVWAEVALSAIALQNRELVKVIRSGRTRRAEVTEAGRFYVEHGHHPDRPSQYGGRTPAKEVGPQHTARAGDERDPPRDNVGKALSPEMDTAITELLESLEAGAGTLRISEPNRADRARWRRVIHAAKAGGRIPPGHHLRHRGRDHGDLVIKLVEGDHPEAHHWQRDNDSPRVVVPVEPTELFDPLACAFVTSRQEWLSAETTTRATRLVNALVGAARHRGHAVRLGGEPGAMLEIDVDGCALALRMFEEHSAVERVQLPTEAATAKLYDWQRVKPETTNEPTGRLVIELADYDRDVRRRRRRWGDTKRWRLDDKLGEILGEVEARAALVNERRRLETEEKARRQQLWKEAMQLATSRYHDAVRGQALRAQIDAWQEACRVRRFCKYLDELAGDQSDPERRTEIRSWAAWGRAFADRKDPGTWPKLLPDVKEPDPEDLRPYLDRWSPYGPDERGYRRPW